MQNLQIKFFKFLTISQPPNTPQLQVNEDFLKEMRNLQSTAKISVYPVVGQGRVGKSTFLTNLLVLLQKNGLLPRNVSVQKIFKGANSIEGVTFGVDVAIVPLLTGDTEDYLLLMDMEGLNNDDHPGLSLALGALLQLTNHLTFMAPQLNDTTINDLGRIVGSGMILTNASNDDQKSISNWPFLHVIINKNTLSDIPADGLDRYISRIRLDDTRKSIEAAFPANRRDISSMRYCQINLDTASNEEIHKSDYGQELLQYYNRIDIRSIINSHLKISSTSPTTGTCRSEYHTPQSFALHISEIARLTNDRINLGGSAILVVSPNGVDIAAANIMNMAFEKSLDRFQKSENGGLLINSIIGREKEIEIEPRLLQCQDEILQLFADECKGFEMFNEYNETKDKLQQSLEESIDSALLNRQCLSEKLKVITQVTEEVNTGKQIERQTGCGNKQWFNGKQTKYFTKYDIVAQDMRSKIELGDGTITYTDIVKGPEYEKQSGNYSYRTQGRFPF